jgi:type II secretory pathway pseudopilin PulG
MRRRQAFTLVEMLVSLALIMFIMAIISEAFVASAKTFRDLKAAADMADRLRVTTNTMRRMLMASHFGGGGKLSDGSVWQNNFTGTGPPIQGFFRIYQGSANTPDGGAGAGDTSIQLPSPTTQSPGGAAASFPSYTVTNCSLHFTAKLSGSDMNSYFYGYAPAETTANSSFLSQGNPEARFQIPVPAAPNNLASPPYSCQWAEVAFFLGSSTDSANGQALYPLYMRQRLLVPFNASGALTPYQVTGITTQADYVEISGTWSATSPYTLTGNRPFDITEPPRRFGMNSTVAGSSINYSGQFANGTGYTTLATDTSGTTDYQNFAGAVLLMTDVVSFEVRVLPGCASGTNGFSDFVDVFQMAQMKDSTNTNYLWAFNNPAFYSPSVAARASLPMVFDTWSQAPDSTYDYSNWNGGSAGNGNYDAIPFADSGNGYGLPCLKAIQITLRVWDLKTETTRQVTVVVPL